jgi:hypothetical protein
MSYFSYGRKSAQITQRSKSHLKIVGARRVTLSKFHSKDPPILGATIQNWDAKATWHPALVHPWRNLSYMYACIVTPYDILKVKNALVKSV